MKKRSADERLGNANDPNAATVDNAVFAFPGSQRLQHAAIHVENPGFQSDGILPATSGYVEGSSIQVNLGTVEYMIPVTTATAAPTYSQPLDLEAGSARYAATPLTTAGELAGSAYAGYGLTTATADPTYSQPLDLEAGSAHYAATPLTTADEVAGNADYGALLTTADSTYATPHDTSQA